MFCFLLSETVTKDSVKNFYRKARDIVDYFYLLIIGQSDFHKIQYFLDMNLTLILLSVKTK